MLHLRGDQKSGLAGDLNQRKFFFIYAMYNTLFPAVKVVFESCKNVFFNKFNTRRSFKKSHFVTLDFS